MGSGLQRHDQHGHLRARADDLRLHRRRAARSTSRARSSRSCSPRASPCSAPIAEGYWEDVGTLEAYLRAHKDVLDQKVLLDIPGFGCQRRRVDGGGRRDLARRPGRRPGGDRARLQDRGRAATRRVRRARLERAAAGRRRHRTQRRARQRVHRLGRAAAGRGDRPGEQHPPERALRRGRRCSATRCSSASDAVLGDDVKVYPFKTIEDGAVVNTSIVWESRGARAACSAATA